MNEGRPLLIYDGRCGFCGIWIRYFQRLTENRVDYAPSQEAEPDYLEISHEEFQRSVWLVRSDRSRASGARAVFELMALARGKSWLLWLYLNALPFQAISEASYRLVAEHRNFFYWITRIFWGRELFPASYRQTRSLILKGLALIFLTAFLSLIPQLSGLIGPHGISPASEYLEAIRSNIGIERYWLLPTLAWLNSGDFFIHALCWAGCGLALALLAGIMPRAALLGMFVFYLSIVSVGQDFLSFQWDVLLLETAFAATLLTRRLFFPRKAPPPGQIGIWLMRFLVFRLMLESGLVKILSGDPSWRNLTALNFHYETQPLPTPLGWYAHQLPAWFQKFSTGGVFAVELLVPFLFLMPRRLRIMGAWITIVFQLLIAATGNYTFFNLLTILLCVSLFDDRHIQRFIPAKFRSESIDIPTQSRTAVVMGALLIVLGFFQLVVQTAVLPSLSPLFLQLLEPAERFHIVNGYGLFAVMTVSRPEIVIEGSNDGSSWRTYVFKYKAGNLHQPPHWVAPYQPRLDWQMWFAALSDDQDTPWFAPFMKRLLEGSPEVLSLLAENPFPDQPPRLLRATRYNYRFTDRESRQSSGDWWTRTYSGPYFPEVSLKR
jgi:predicted DCC family thiol-disulfide oxidoreductase YuxK